MKQKLVFLPWGRSRSKNIWAQQHWYLGWDAEGGGGEAGCPVVLLEATEDGVRFRETLIPPKSRTSLILRQLLEFLFKPNSEDEKMAGCLWYFRPLSPLKNQLQDDSTISSMDPDPHFKTQNMDSQLISYVSLIRFTPAFIKYKYEHNFFQHLTANLKLDTYFNIFLFLNC